MTKIKNPVELEKNWISQKQITLYTYSPWTVHGQSMDSPWTVYGLSMDNPMDSPWGGVSTCLLVCRQFCNVSCAGSFVDTY